MEDESQEKETSFKSKFILWLDDSAERTAVFFNRCPENIRPKVIWCQNVTETITTLRDYCDNLEEVSLDHDLGAPGFMSNPLSPECGMEVVRWLENHYDIVEVLLKNRCRITIHSFNVYAGDLMQSHLERLGFKVNRHPFGT